MTAGKTSTGLVLDGMAAALPELVELYRDLHANPELSGQERRTAAAAAARLERAGFEVTSGVGGTGVVGVLRNGEGPQLAGRVAEDIPTNHNARFAPVIHPTLETGIEAMTAAALDGFDSTMDPLG